MSTTTSTICLTGPQTIECINQTIDGLQNNQVLIETHCSLISSGTELSIYSHSHASSQAWQEFSYFPRSMGYSNVGTVIEIGAEVDSAWLGKRVASRGCHSLFVVRDVEDLRVVPDNVSDEDATFAILAAVAMNGLRRGRLVWGEDVAVRGLGILGQLSVRLAIACGANTLAAVDRQENRLSRLPGVFHKNSMELRQYQRFASLNSLRSAINENSFSASDLFIEASGEAGLISSEIECVRDQGRLLILSSPTKSTLFDFHEFCNRRSIEIIGAHGFSQPKIATPSNPWTSQRHGTLFLSWLDQNKFSVQELISHRFSYREAVQAYHLLHTDQGGTAAVIIHWRN